MATFREETHAVIARCPDCDRIECQKDAAVESYNETVRGTDGWGNSQTTARYKVMTAEVRECHRAQKAAKENPVTELARVALPWSGVNRP